MSPLSDQLYHLLQPGKLVLFVSDPDPGDGVDGDPVAAVPVVRLQLCKVGGVAWVWLPANTADLQEKQFQSCRLEGIFTSEKFLSLIFPKYLSNSGIIGAPGKRSGSNSFLKCNS